MVNTVGPRDPCAEGTSEPMPEAEVNEPQEPQEPQTQEDDEIAEGEEEEKIEQDPPADPEEVD